LTFFTVFFGALAAIFLAAFLTVFFGAVSLAEAFGVRILAGRRLWNIRRQDRPAAWRQLP